MVNGELVRNLLAPWRDEIAGVAGELARAGWAEAGAGNVSVRLDGPNPAAAADRALLLPLAVPELAGRAFIVSVAGSRMREIARDPAPHFGLLAVGPDGASGRWLGARPPTSELAAHLACHAVLARQSPAQRCLLHAHPTALIALGRLVSRPDDLLAMLAPAGAESTFLRDRLAVTPPLPPGSEELARASAGLVGRFPAVAWPGHGMLTAGETFGAALDLIQLADKAAAVALAGLHPAAGTRAVGRPMRPGRSLQGRPAPDGIETRYEVRSRDSALPPAEFARLPRRPVFIVLDNIRSAFNVGSIFRLADACRAAEVITCGYTAHPPHHKLDQAALGTTGSVPWRSARKTVAVLSELRGRGVQLVAAETAAPAVPYHRFEYRPPVALVFGNEALGLPGLVLDACDGVVDIPVAGLKNSINVAAAAGILLFDLCRRQGWLEPG
ncbi:MAG: TrmH family RNA methyltransferase [bacterium]